jgi:NAD(P)-dependent dehydrogenase (short-subunit alcohol dehydrogenase family)
VKTYAAELNVTPVKANLFSPGPVRTAMRAKAFPGEDPMTLPAPEEVAPAICDMLAPDYAANGETVRFTR